MVDDSTVDAHENGHEEWDVHVDVVGVEAAGLEEGELMRFSDS